MNIRKATTEDINSNLLNIYIDGYKFHVKGRKDIFSDMSDEDIKEDLLSIVKNDGNIIVAEKSNKVVGFVVFKIKAKRIKTLWIDQLVVDLNERGKGIAKSLINRIYEIAKEEGCSKVELSCWSFNENASNMYKHLGFKEQRTVLEKNII